jgi:hypothetical protein
MSTVKISQLPLITALNANTANSLFMGVDIPTGVTGKFTAHTLAQGLYSNEVLNVGGNPVLYSNVISQFAGNSEVYLQINLQNLKGNGSSDFVASTSDSDNSTKYIDMGISGNTFSDPATYSAFKAYDGYLYTYGPNATSAQGNLILGTASSNANVVMLVGGLHANNIVGWYTKNGISLNTQSYITFADGTIQYTAAAAVSNAYIQAAFAAANTAAANIAIMQGVNTTQNTNITAVNTYAASAYGAANTNATNITVIQGVDATQNTNITTANNAAWAAYAAANTNATDIAVIQGVNTTQNTNITAVNTYAGSAYAAGNTNATNITAVNTYAGSAYAAANLSLDIDTTQNTNITTANNAAWAAYAAANTNATDITTVNTYAGSAYAAANLALGIDATQNTNITTANNAAWAAYAAGNTNATNITAVNTYAGSAYGAANTNATNITAVNTYAASAYDAANTNATNITVIQGVNSGQNTFTQAAFDKANTSVQNTAVITVNSITLTGNLIANGLGQSASIDNFTSNSATFNQNVTVLGNLTANTLLGNVFFSNVVTDTSQANSILWFPQATSPTQVSGQVWYSSNTISLIQDTDVPGDRPAISKVLFERVYNNTSSAIPNSSWVRLAGGVTSNSIPYVQLADAGSAANSQVEGFVKVGIAAGAYGFVYTRGIVDGMNASTFGQNGQLLFLSTTPGQSTNTAPTGAISVVSVAKILSNESANGKLQIAVQSLQAYGKPNGAILFANNNLIQASNTLFINESLGRLNVSSMIYAANGSINRSNTYTDTQTAITVNMLTETWVRVTVGASLTITPTGFGPGYETEVVVINPNTGGGSARTITHGCSATNSSVGATTFSLGGTTTAFLKYYSFDGDLANTYVSVSYS